MKRMLSGIKPTGELTLGNYIGALRNFVKYQDDYELYVFIANLHCVTVYQDPKELRKNLKDAIALYLACGLDPERCLPDFTPCNPEPLRRIVLRGGAFGFADPTRRQAAGRGPVARKLHAAGAFLRRLPFSLHYAPRETLATVAELVKGNL